MKINSKHPLGSLLKKAMDDPFFLGWAINRYALSYHMDRESIATLLQCSNSALDQLALCRLPNSIDPQFAAQVKRIAEYVGCNSNRLAAIIREIAVIDVLEKSNGSSGKGYLMAARDRRKKENDEKTN